MTNLILSFNLVMLSMLFIIEIYEATTEKQSHRKKNSEAKAAVIFFCVISLLFISRLI